MKAIGSCQRLTDDVLHIGSGVEHGMACGERQWSNTRVYDTATRERIERKKKQGREECHIKEREGGGKMECERRFCSDI